VRNPKTTAAGTAAAAATAAVTVVPPKYLWIVQLVQALALFFLGQQSQDKP
jgi:hypothetical protein